MKRNEVKILECVKCFKPFMVVGKTAIRLAHYRPANAENKRDTKCPVCVGSI